MYRKRGDMCHTFPYPIYYSKIAQGSAPVFENEGPLCLTAVTSMFVRWWRKSQRSAPNAVESHIPFLKAGAQVIEEN